jgi:SOS-response transcriptional repressor LexA
MSLADMIVAARKAKGLSRSEVARAVGMSDSGYGFLESGKTKTTDKWRELADALGLAHDKVRDAMDGTPRRAPNAKSVRLITRADGSVIGGFGGAADDRLTPPRLVPVLGHAAAGASGRLIIGEPISYEASPPWLDKAQGAYLLYVAGDSMVPRFYPGEMISIHPGRPYAKGDFVVVQVDEDGDTVGLVKEFVGWADNGDLLLTQFNKPQEIRIAGETVKDIHRVVIPGLS